MNPVLSTYFSRLLLGLPVLSLVLGAIAWLRFGIDLPFFDDWKSYSDGTIGSLKPAYLFRSINDTVTPIGFVFDGLAQRYLDGNSVAYQFLTMVILLGSLLALQWKLLRKTLGSKLQTAICFAFTVPMLQPGSYWGQENLAFHQGLPLVFILGALWLLAGPGHAGIWRGPAVAALALLAGFSYISGAFGALMAGLSLLVVSLICFGRDERRELNRDTLWFIGAAAFAVVCQYSLSEAKLRGTHAGIPMALPTELQFWMFALGKVARSLVLPASRPLLSLVVTLLVCGAAIAAAVALIRKARAPGATAVEKRLVALYIPIATVVFIYLIMVAAGRANFRPPEMTRPLDIFAHGFTRFHFFWITLLWPWLVAALLVIVQRWSRFGGALSGWSGISLALLAVALMAGNGAYAHVQNQRDIAVARAKLARCFLEGLQTGAEVRCPGLIPQHFADTTPDAYPAYVHARERGASFTRYFPLMHNTKRRLDIAAFFEADVGQVQARLQAMEALGSGSYRLTGNDPNAILKMPQAGTMRRCVLMDVDVSVKVSQAGEAEVFYLPAGATEFSEQHSARTLALASEAGFQVLSFRLESETGFEQVLRFDPATAPQDVQIGAIRLFCLVQR